MKKHILVVICILLCGMLFAEEALWVTAEDTPAWNSSQGPGDLYIQDIAKTFPKDTKVILNDHGRYGSNIIDREGCLNYFRYTSIYDVTIDGEDYWVEAKNIVPLDTPDLFDESFLTEAYDLSRRLIPSYFADVLKSGTRSTMTKYEKEFIELLGDGYKGEYYDKPAWWTDAELTRSSEINQNSLHIKFNVEFLVKRIEKIPNGYKVGVQRFKWPFEDSFFPPDRSEYPIFFQFDGDYVDIYIDNLSNKVFSLTYVSPDFHDAVQDVISADVPVDASNLIWPRRADGSSDYDDKIIPQQELPKIQSETQENISIVIDETTTLEEVKEALKKTASMNLLDDEGVLLSAISNTSNVEIVKLLLESGAKVRDSILDYTASYTDNVEIYKLIIELGGVDANYYYATPLDTAIKKNRSFEIIKLLIESGVPIKGRTLISAVNHSDNMEIYKLLIESGVDINESDNSGQTPLTAVVQQQNPSLEFIKFLLESGASASINAIDYSGQTTLRWALGSNPEIISILLNAGASLTISVDNRDRSEDFGMNILEISQSYNYPYSSKILAELIKMGWKENSDDKIIWQQRGNIYDTTDNLRLRATEGVSGEPLFTLPKDTPVKILSIGNIEKIDEIIAYWVEVEVAEDTVDTQGEEVKKGAVGWCFGGYLTNENIVYKVSPRTVTEVSMEKATEVEEALPEFESTKRANPIAMWLLLGGGVLLLGAVGTVVVMRKKKK